MVRTIIDLSDKSQTGKEMYYLIKMYYDDLSKLFVKINGKCMPLMDLSLKQFYNFVSKIPYRKDQKPIEVVSRPKHIIKLRKIGMDCKKKGILIGSFLRGNRKRYRLVTSSKKINKRIHHVFPQMKIGRKWYNVDATYPHYKLFQPKAVTNFEVLYG